MVRTQVYLTERERQDLRRLSRSTGRSQSELIRAAIDRFLAVASPGDRAALLRRGRAIWQERGDLPDFGVLRRSWDRT